MSMRSFIKRAYYPGFLAVGFLLLAALVTVWPLKMAAIAGVLLMTGVTWISEYVMPHRAEWNKPAGDFARDFFFTVLLFPIIVEAAQHLALFTENYLPVRLLEGAPLALQVLGGLLAGELLFYGVHRVSHESALVWRLHRYHHSVGRLYWMNSGTFNVIDLVLNFMCYCIPLGLLGGSAEALSLIVYFSALTGLLEHANIDFRAGVLNYVFNTAELHRWHHSVVPRESMSNYGKALIIWDLAFGSYFHPQDRQVDALGADAASAVTSANS